MDLVANGEVKFNFSEKILDEYKRTLAKPRLKLSIETQKKAIDDIKKCGVLVDDPVPSSVEIRDFDDRIFYDVAKENEAILITGDEDLLVLNENFIMKPAQFISLFKVIEGKF